MAKLLGTAPCGAAALEANTSFSFSPYSFIIALHTAAEINASDD